MQRQLVPMVVILAAFLAGCVNQRSVVVPPEEVSGQNDKEWIIKNNPVQSQSHERGRP